MRLSKKAIALRLLLTLALLPIVAIPSIAPAQADTAVNGLCAKNVDVGTNVEISYTPGFCVVKFKSGTVNWTPTSNITYIQYLIVAGGGAGGHGDANSWEGGGGGGGGVLTGYTSVAPGTSYSISVGAGGVGSGTIPQSGGNSTAFSFTAIGGGYGGYAGGVGGAGGSGGGGTYSRTAGGAGTAGQGTSGETPAYTSSGGGGGGASQPGYAGTGGLGLGSAITGTTIYYGDGGGGSRRYDGTTSYYSLQGGSGNGGTGSTVDNANGSAGVANTGGGGGGSNSNSGSKGGDGGSGVVIIRYGVTPSVNGLMGYFRNETTTATTLDTTPTTTGPDYCHSGVYTNFNLNWGDPGSPNSSDGINVNRSDQSTYTDDPKTCKSDHFTGFLFGYIKAPITGNVTFYVNADDNYQLVIDSTTVVSHLSGSLAENSANYYMVKDQIYPIQIFFQEITGGAGLFVNWSYTGQSKDFLNASYLGTTEAVLSTSFTQQANCTIGSSQSCPAYSPQEIKSVYGTAAANGTYWLMVNGVSTQVYVMMESGFDGGGYVLAMKGANTGSTFTYDADYWTKTTTLNPTGATYLARNTADSTVNTDAKFNTFNYLPATKIAATFPEWNYVTSGANSFAPGPIGSNNQYGFSWLESMTANASTFLQLFGETSNRSEIPLTDNVYRQVKRQKLRTYTNTDVGYTGTGGQSFFSTQTYIRWYGFNYVQMEWGGSSSPSYPKLADGITPNPNKARWGLGNNENGPATGQTYTDEDSNDMIGGIGLKGHVTWSAGDKVMCCQSQTGRNTQTKFEMWLKMRNPDLSAPTITGSSTNAAGDITLTWNKPANTVPTEYVVQYTSSATPTWDSATSTTFRVITPGDTTTASAVITGLSKTTEYKFRVFARSQYNLTNLNSSPSPSNVAIRLAQIQNVKVYAAPGTTDKIKITLDAVTDATTYKAYVYTDETLTTLAGGTNPITLTANQATNLYTCGANVSLCYFVLYASNATTTDISPPTDKILGVTNGSKDYALKFTGQASQSAESSASKSSPSMSDMTMEFWVNPSSAANSPNVIRNEGMATIGFNSSTTPTWSFKFDYYFGSWTVTDIPVRTNEWHHIALTRASGSSTAKFYIDGSLVYTINGLANYSFYDGKTVIGGNYFSGLIDEVKFWNSVRTQSNIQSDMNNYVVDTSANKLVAAYDFNEGTGSKAYNRMQGADNISTTTSNSGLDISTNATFQTIETSTVSATYTVVTFPKSYLNATGWAVPSGVKLINAAILSGGGGGGGGAMNSTYAGGGGGGGGGSYANGYFTTSSGETLAVTVGVGGGGGYIQFTTGTAGNDGADGFDSKVIKSSGATAGTISAPGGKGGKGGTLTTGGAGGASGSGNAGAAGSTISNGSILGGGGGGSVAATNKNGAAATTETATGVYYAISLVGVIAGGGAGGSRFASDGGLGGTNAGSAGTALSFNCGADTGHQCAAGTYGTALKGSGGGGGGGSGSSGWEGLSGGGGGSGVVYIKYLNSYSPTYNALKTSYVTTAGASVQVVSTGTTPTPMSRYIIWQKSVDTGTTWTTISGQNTETLTVQTYETMTTATDTSTIMIRGILWDTHTATLFGTDTATITTTIILNPSNQITLTSTIFNGTTTATSTALTDYRGPTYTTPYVITKKYGDTFTAVMSFSYGTGTRTPTLATTAQRTAGTVTWSNSSSSGITLTVQPTLWVGTYYETLTVTDTATAVTTLQVTINITKADTITVVTSISPSAINYNGSPVTGTTRTVTGLKNSDAIAATTTATCQNGGACKVGDIAPGGGYVFYVASNVINKVTGISPSGGVYLATSPESYAKNLQFCESYVLFSGLNASIGSGANNTKIMNSSSCTSSSYAVGYTASLSVYDTATNTTFSDWFLPSDYELYEIYKLYKNVLNKSAPAHPVYSGNRDYYASTQDSYKNPRAVNLDSGSMTYTANGPSNGVMVFPVRAFSPTGSTFIYSSVDCASGGLCNVGDIAPGGGYVFKVSTTDIDSATGISAGGKYLATAPTTFNATSIWCSTFITNTYVQKLSGTIGTGASNTLTAMDACNETSTATYLTANLYDINGYDDWFLPSLDELLLIYTELKVNRSIAFATTGRYWSSTSFTTTENAAVPFDTGSWTSTGFTTTQNYLPIRAFSPRYEFSTAPPTDAGTYNVASLVAIASPNTLDNYQGIQYTNTTVTINRAPQTKLTVGQYAAFVGMQYPLNVYGGSGPGILKRTLSAAGSSNCSLNSTTYILTATAAGICTVQVTKAGTPNYLTESSTAIIYWVVFVPPSTVSDSGGPHSIPITDGNSVIKKNDTVTATSFTDTAGNPITTANKGDTIRILVSGYGGLTANDLTVYFKPYEDAVINSVTSTYVEVVVPTTAVSGTVGIDGPRGVSYTPTSITIP